MTGIYNKEQLDQLPEMLSFTDTFSHNEFKCIYNSTDTLPESCTLLVKKLMLKTTN